MTHPTEGAQDDSEGNYARHVAMLRAQMEGGIVGGNRECPYFPCHHPDQDCTFCFCPLYPCGDPLLGEYAISQRTGGQV